MKKELEGVAREDGRWAEYEEHLRNYISERKDEKESVTLVDVGQWPVSDLFQPVQDQGQWNCEVCSVVNSDTRYRCTSCGRVNFTAFQALHREEGDAAIAVAEQIIRLVSPSSVVSLRANEQVSKPPQRLAVASMNTAPQSLPVEKQADLPNPSASTQAVNPPLQATLPAAHRDIPDEPDKQASLPADTKAIIPQFPSERAPPTPISDNRKIREDRPSKRGKTASKQCCSLS